MLGSISNEVGYINELGTCNYEVMSDWEWVRRG